MSVKGSDLSSLTLAIADLKAIDARLTALGAADPPIESDGANLTAAIRDSRALVRAAIARLTGNQIAGEAPNEPADKGSGSAKRRVKIKAESETSASAVSARAEAGARSGTAARSGDRARNVSAAASAAAATTAKTPPNSLLARLGAATPEASPRHQATADGGGAPASATTGQPDNPAAPGADERLARLEAEIDSLTEATATGPYRSKAMASDAPVRPAATKTTEAEAPARAAVPPARTSAHQPDVRDDGTGDDEDDAEIVIVTAQGKVAGIAEQGQPPNRQSPRTSRDPSPTDDEDAEVEIVQPGSRPGAQPDADERARRLAMTPDGGRVAAAASKPASPAKWRLFRGSR